MRLFESLDVEQILLAPGEPLERHQVGERDDRRGNAVNLPGVSTGSELRIGQGRRLVRQEVDLTMLGQQVEVTPRREVVVRNGRTVGARRLPRRDQGPDRDTVLLLLPNDCVNVVRRPNDTVTNRGDATDQDVLDTRGI